jgi:hypothetical protein
VLEGLTGLDCCGRLAGRVGEQPACGAASAGGAGGRGGRGLVARCRSGSGRGSGCVGPSNCRCVGGHRRGRRRRTHGRIRGCGGSSGPGRVRPSSCRNSSSIARPPTQVTSLPTRGSQVRLGVGDDDALQIVEGRRRAAFAPRSRWGWRGQRTWRPVPGVATATLPACPQGTGDVLRVRGVCRPGLPGVISHRFSVTSRLSACNS